MSRSDHEARHTGGRGPLRTDGRFHVWRVLDLVHDGRTFLRRRGVDVRAFGVLVHRIDAPDPGLDLHDHPWPFISIILRGGYTEEWAQVPLLLLPGKPPLRILGHGLGTVRRRRWSRWSAHAVPLGVAHRIVSVEPGTVTLVLRGRKVRRWGFFPPEGWIDWEDYDYAARRPLAVASNRPGEARTGGDQ